MSTRGSKSAGVADTVATAPLAGAANELSDTAYFKSVDAFYQLRNSAMNGTAPRALSNLGAPGPVSTELFGVGASIGSEDASTRELYGRHSSGQSSLLARRHV